MLAQAEQIAAQSEVAPYERFSVVETEDGYGIWDDIRDEYYVDEDGVTADFDSEWAAEDYLKELQEKVAQKEADEWEYIERSKFEAQSEEINAEQTDAGTVSAEPEAVSETESVPRIQSNDDLLGVALTMDGRRFVVDEIHDNTASLRDITFQNGTGFPIFRSESVDRVRGILYPEQTIVPSVNLEATVTTAQLELLRPQLDEAGIDYLVVSSGHNSCTISFSSEHYQAVQDMLDALPDEPEYTTEQEAVYPSEHTGLPYDIVVERIRTEPEHTPPAQNFHITDEHLGEGGTKAKFRMNMDSIHLLKQLEADGRQATPDEQAVLAKYVGWGGLADAFDESKSNWSAEFQELRSALTTEEYETARSSTLNAHYTSPTVIRAMYEALERMGFETGNILEPSMGVGNFFGCLPEKMQNSRLYGVELDSITGRIAKQLYLKADITVAGFETTDRRDFYDVAIGNVPFGQYQVNDRAYNKLGFSIYDYFFGATRS